MPALDLHDDELRERARQLGLLSENGDMSRHARNTAARSLLADRTPDDAGDLPDLDDALVVEIVVRQGDVVISATSQRISMPNSGRNTA